MDYDPTNPEEMARHIEKDIGMLKKAVQGEVNMDAMPNIENVFKPGTNSGDGMGFGGGALGLVALLALLNRNVLNGGWNGVGDGMGGAGGSAVNQLTLGQIQGTLGDIKAAVPLAEAQVQLALAGVQGNINSNLNSATGGLQTAIAMLQLQNANSSAALGDKLDAGFAANSLATAQSQFAIAQAVYNDGTKTRELIQSIDKTNDSRLITSQANEIVELRQRNETDRTRHGLEITMTNNQNQNQLQFQQQAQVLGVLSNGLVDALQSIRATNQAINIGSGTQTANPLNNNTNVRA